MQPISNSDSFVDKPITSLESAVYALHTAQDTSVVIQDYFIHKKSANYSNNYIYSRETGRNKVIVYRSKSGTIKRAWDSRC